MTKKAAAPAEPEKKKRKKVLPYKHVPHSGTVSDISSAIGTLEELASECREIVDNASDNLQQTQRIQTMGETADTLENISEPDVPECAQDLEISYTEQVNRNKRRGPSRAVRRDNAVAILEGAKSALEEAISEHREQAERYEDLTEEEQADHDEPKYTVEQCDEMQALADELDNLISEAENVEFPGMYG